MDALTQVESEVIDVDDTEEVEIEACLLGRLVTKKNWNPSNLIEDIAKAWKPKHGMSSRELGESKLILFRFDDAIERDWVLKNQPWIFNDTLFVIEKFTGRNEQQVSSSVNITIEHASFWARLYDVPFSCMDERSLRHFAKQIGILETMDTSGEDSIGKFIRFKVSMNITKPLLRGITVRVKGKHLWLPLKYESLPIYCFSCGTIGHDHKNCRSYNRNLKYSTLKLKGIEERKDTPTTLPHDIIENILSRVPAKYLMRYKSVCKLWEATISDPSFSETHFIKYKNSFSRNLLAWEQHYDYEGLHVSEIQSQQFHYLSVIKHSRKYSSLLHGFLCDCNGIYLKHFYTRNKMIRKTYLLWNPSCGAYKEFQCPQPIDDRDTRSTLYGIYYNALMKDYKVVIADETHYAVFTCKSEKWGDVKEVKGATHDEVFSWSSSGEGGVSFNGSLYWKTTILRQRNFFDFEIICFNWKAEKFKKLPMPDFKEKPYSLSLTCSGSHLFLFLVMEKSPDFYNEMRFWKKLNDDKDSWMEFKVKVQPEYCPCTILFIRPICWVNEDEIMLDINLGSQYLLYDQSKNTFVMIQQCQFGKYYNPIIYQENLLLQ